MALPMNTTPVYQLEIPSLGKKVNFRPFLVKEEKALLLAQQSEDPMVMLTSLKDVIKSCIKDDLDVDALATFDIEYVFTQLRAKSVGEIIDLSLKCDKCDDEKAISKVNIDLTKLEIDKPEGHESNINLFDDVGVVMKYPTMDILKKLESVSDDNLDEVFEVMIECIDSIYNSSEVFHAKEQSKQEMLDFLNNLSSDQFVKIRQFFETMPRLKYDVEYTCPVCNKEHKKILEGLQSFF